MFPKLASRALDEIRASPGLQIYGAALCLTHLLTYLYYGHEVVPRLTSVIGPQCWPFFQDCDRVRIFSPSMINVTWHLYLAFSLVGATLFFTRRLGAAFSVLAGLELLKLLIEFQDYSLMGNYHYMVHWVTLAYLLLPHKALASRLLIGGFYLSAGSLKLNEEWLSGAALGRPLPGFGPYLYQLSLAYVVVLELFIVLGLYSRSRVIRVLSLVQLLVFHAMSWQFVGFFYPLVMFSLLLIFPISWIEAAHLTPDVPPRPIPALPITTLALILIFAAMQFSRNLSARDSALYGQLRLLNLNMFDATVECDSAFYLKQRGSVIEYTPSFPESGRRIRCDSVMFLNEARNLCRQSRVDPDFQEMDVQVLAKRSTADHYEKVLDLRDACQKLEKASRYQWFTQEF